MSRDVLDLIDNVLDDYATSCDAMRWAPDAPEPGRVQPLAMMQVRERFGPVFNRLGVTLTDWQYELVGRIFEVPVQMLLSRAEVERRTRLSRIHSDYHRRTRRRNRGR